MKELIILCCSVMLGIFIYGLIMGDQGDSIMTSLGRVWQSGLETRTYGR